MVWCGSSSETAWMQRRQKNWLKCTEFTEVKNITSRLYSNCSNYSSLFSSPFFVAVHLVSWKTNSQLTAQVLLTLLFTSWHFFKRVGFLVGFIVFFLVFFLVGSNCINPENNYGCLTDFLSQISKLSYFNLLDLADFMMHRTSFRFRFLC